MLGKPILPFGPPGFLPNGRFLTPRLGIDVGVLRASRRDLVSAPGMTRLADDAGIVAATGQYEGDVVGCDEMDLVDRAPRSDVIGNGADGETRNADTGEPDGTAIDLEMPLRQIVVQEEPAQIFRVHAIRHARGVRIPSHQIV